MTPLDAFRSKQGRETFIYGGGVEGASQESNAPGSDLAQSQSGNEQRSLNTIKVRPLAGISIPVIKRREDYEDFVSNKRVQRVIEEARGSSGTRYRVEYEDGLVEEVSSASIKDLANGVTALASFRKRVKTQKSSPADSVGNVSSRRSSGAGRRITLISESESGSEDILSSRPTTNHDARRTQINARALRSGVAAAPPTSKWKSDSSDEMATSSDSSSSTKRRRTSNGRLTRSLAAMRATRHSNANYQNGVSRRDEESDESSDEEYSILKSDVVAKGTKRKKGTARPSKAFRSSGARRSERATRNQENMEEVGVDDVYRSDSDPDRPARAPKAVGVKEVFESLPRSDPFHIRHCQQCDTCGNVGSGAHGQLVHCQGCSLSYHTKCLGTRTTRDHLVTKVGADQFVLQCRRCVSFAKRKELTAPEQGLCQSCREIGRASHPFRVRKTAVQEQRDRDENDGEDPIVPLDSSIINNADNVLFRCMSCWRAFHYHHLVPRSEVADAGLDEASIAAQRFKEYSRDWMCKDCCDVPAKVSGLVAWRPVDTDSYIPGLRVQEANEDEKEYLIKWEGKSYFRAQWMPGAWTWGITASAMRRAFEKRNDNNNIPTFTTEDAIPEDFLRIDVVLDVKFTSIVNTRAEEVDKARIREVDRALIKYKGLGYEDVVWEAVPSPEDGDRWSDFVTAYDDWVMGRYIRVPNAPRLKQRVEKARATEFTTLEKKKQPESLIGGELMNYQLEGLNWLYYRWHTKKNAILADEMGLGKTIQIIGMLTTLVHDHHCFPFLVVVPNSTCPNWRREIKQWAPSLRVVTYFGSSTARSLAYQYELFPEGSKELRCHVVVTSYDAAADDNCRKFFKSVPWQGLIVDEGQRLKNDKNILYDALGTLKIPYRILLTGTPLQNNARELFNLLQFLDEAFDAAALELEYAELTKENVPQLHDLMRPFFLRRTKAQVLTFLPPMAQIILPVSMSVVQKKLYLSILAKNPELVRAIFDTRRALGKVEHANLSNILMQLRKCLCHPFVYSKEIEERSVTAAVSHRNLVEASGKLQLLELLLPKLKERGHRVLIFSQFLDMLDIVEDFLDGLELRYQRLDGTMSSLVKQKRIDEFNAPESQLFAFLLSTRAGGIGINLASADTVIILDPDFNPHQDIQALSRAHRIGQNRKVLCFQLMTRQSAEEKIVQIGRKKMALDHVLIEQMDADEDSVVDMESVLRFGAAEILEDKTVEFKYDDASVEKLLDRSQIEDTKSGEDRSAESQFSFARVWANDSASMQDSLPVAESEEKAPDPTVWDRILKERERAAAEEAATRQQALGRGKRARHTVDYATEVGERSGARRQSDSDTDFQAEEKSEAEESADEDPGREENIVEREELTGLERVERTQQLRGTLGPNRDVVHGFKRSNILWPTDPSQPLLPPSSKYARLSEADLDRKNPVQRCIGCGTVHRLGYCPLKLAGPEYCNLCGIAHYGVARTCPHIRSETQVREMLAALKQSPEAKHLVNEATRYLQGVKGSIVQDKKRRAEREALRAAATQIPNQAVFVNHGQSAGPAFNGYHQPPATFPTPFRAGQNFPQNSPQNFPQNFPQNPPGTDAPHWSGNRAVPTPPNGGYTPTAPRTGQQS